MQAADDSTAGAAASILTSRAASEGGLAGDPWTRPKPSCRAGTASRGYVRSMATSPRASDRGSAIHSIRRSGTQRGRQSLRSRRRRAARGVNAAFTDGLRSTRPPHQARVARPQSGRTRAASAFVRRASTAQSSSSSIVPAGEPGAGAPAAGDAGADARSTGRARQGRGPRMVHVESEHENDAARARRASCSSSRSGSKPEWQVPAFKGDIGKIHVSRRQTVSGEMRSARAHE